MYISGEEVKKVLWQKPQSNDHPVVNCGQKYIIEVQPVPSTEDKIQISEINNVNQRLKSTFVNFLSSCSFFINCLFG